MDDNLYAKAELSEAELREMIDNITKTDISRDKLMKTYDVWAPHYDKVTFRN